MRRFRTRTNRILSLALVMVLIGFGVASVSSALSAGDPRRGTGYPGPGANEWTGSYRLFTGPNQTGEQFLAYCLEDGANHPHGTSSPNSGFTPFTDYLGIRGATLAERQSLSYILWKYGNTTNQATAAAVHQSVGILSHDPSYNDGAPPQWILNEGMANRGPWTAAVTLTPEGGRIRTRMTVTGPGGPISGATLIINLTNLTNSGLPSGPFGPYAVADAAGKATFLSDAVNPAIGSAVIVQATSPGYYRIFWGRPTTDGVPTQKAITRTDSSLAGGGTYTPDDVPPPEVNAETYIRKVTTNPAYQSGQGAVFEVHEGSNASGTVAATLTVGPDGKTNVATLPPGTYHVVETVAPQGQTITFAPRTVTLTDGQALTIDAENGVLAEGELRLIKLDDATGDALAGAQFKVDFDSNRDGSFETPIGTYTSELDPVSVTGLKAGNYRVEETVAPPGYALAEPSQRIQMVTISYGTPRPGDESLVVTVTVRDNFAGLTSQVVVPGNGLAINAVSQNTDGTIPAIADSVTVAGVPSDGDGEITTSLYGPQTSSDPAAAVCSPATLVSEETFAATGPGPHQSPAFTLPQAGVYSFVSSWKGRDGSEATQPCGEASETVFVPSISTEISSQNTTFGDSISDTAVLTGVPTDSVGEINVKLFGPFTSVGQITCTTESEVWSSQIATSGPGTYTSEDFTPTSAGVYTFVETWTSGDGSSSASHRCGETTETTVMNPTVTTEISKQVIEPGDSVFDTAVLAGVPDGFTGRVDFSLYGPFAAGAVPDCATGSLLETVATTSSGSGQVVSPEITVTEPGIYTFVASWASDGGELSATHACGLTEETTTVGTPPVDVPPTTPTTPTVPVPPVTPPSDSSSGGGSGGGDGGSGGGDGATGVLARTGSDPTALVVIGCMALLAGFVLLIPMQRLRLAQTDQSRVHGGRNARRRSQSRRR